MVNCGEGEAISWAFAATGLEPRRSGGGHERATLNEIGAKLRALKEPLGRQLPKLV